MNTKIVTTNFFADKNWPDSDHIRFKNKDEGQFYFFCHPKSVEIPVGGNIFTQSQPCANKKCLKRDLKWIIMDVYSVFKRFHKVIDITLADFFE